MPRFKKIRTGDVVTVPDALVKRYDADNRYERFADAKPAKKKAAKTSSPKTKTTSAKQSPAEGDK